MSGSNDGRDDPTAFRLRGLEFSRLDAFSDVVFGFALTLLVVSLEVPKTFGELMEAMRGFVPFAACFALLLLVWHGHYKFFRRYGLHDFYTIVLNMVLLFVVLFYVYPLKFLFTYLFNAVTGRIRAIDGPGAVLPTRQIPELMIIYGLGFATVFFIFVLLYRHALHSADDLDLNELERHDTKWSISENGLLVAIGLLSVLVAIVLPAGLSGLSGYAYFLIGIAMWVHGAARGKSRRKLLERRARKSVDALPPV